MVLKQHGGGSTASADCQGRKNISPQICKNIMNKKKIPILVLRVVWMGLLDGETESRLVAFPDQDDQDVNASAERLAEEHGAVLLQVEQRERAILYI